MGRTKMPIEMKVAHGTYQASRDGHKLPIPHAKPTPPKWIAKEARAHWREIVSLFDDLQVLTKLDQVALGLFGDCLARYIKFRDMAEKSEWISVSEKGGEYQHPACGMMNKSIENINRYLMHFGMTPVARAKLAMGNKEAERDPMTELLQKISEKRMTN